MFAKAMFVDTSTEVVPTSTEWLQCGDTVLLARNFVTLCDPGRL